MSRLGWLLVALSLSGCVTQPIPEGYKGPVATVADSGFSEDGTKGQLFVLAEIDGNPVRNSIGASASASHGQGFALTTRVISRQVPAKPMKVLIKGTHVTGAPIHSLFNMARGTFLSVEGAVDFSPAPDGTYVVKGELKKDGSSVWIEDTRTRQPVTVKVTAK